MGVAQIDLLTLNKTKRTKLVLYNIIYISNNATSAQKVNVSNVGGGALLRITDQFHYRWEHALASTGGAFATIAPGTAAFEAIAWTARPPPRRITLHYA